MALCPCNDHRRRRPSLRLDAGYVIYQSTETVGLHGKKFFAVIGVIICLFLISLINLTCLMWLIRKLDWSLFDKHGWRTFRIDQKNQRVEFYKPIRSNESIYTTQITHNDQMNVLANEQLEVSGDQHSIVLDERKIVLNSDRLSMNNQTAIDFTNLQSFKFSSLRNTRIYIDQVHSQQIYDKQLNLTANDHLIISKMNRAFFSSRYLELEASREHQRSTLQFRSHSPKRISSGNLHLKSDSLYFDLPRFPLLGTNYHRDLNISRLCICNSTLLYLQTFIHQPCPSC